MRMPLISGLFLLAAMPLASETGPVLSLDLSSYWGGTRFDHVRDIAFDSSGNAYVVGGTESPGLQYTNSIVNQGSAEPGSTPMDVFVAKFDPSGRRLWTTVVGGPNYDRAYAVEVDAQGFVYVAGRAGAGFPVTSAAFQRTFMSGSSSALYGNQDGFVFKMTSDGYSLVWASYFGADDGAMIRDLVLDDQRNVYVASQHTAGSTYPGTIQQVFNRGPFPQPAGNRDQVVAKVKADGSQLVWAMHLGGSGNEAGESTVRVDSAGNPVVLTTTTSTNAKTTVGAYSRTLSGPSDFYIVKVKADGTGLIFGTYLGGSNAEAVETHHLAIDSHDNVILAAGTLSANFPMKGGFDSSYNGSGGSGTGGGTNYAGDAIVAKLSADGTQLLASTFLGGRYGDQAEGVWLDAEGSVFVAGGTYSDNFPMAGGGFQTTRNGPADGFVAKLSSSLGSLLYSTYLGGSGIDYLRTATVDSQGNVFVGGETQSSDFPLLNELQATYRGSTDGMLARFRGTPELHTISGRVMLSDTGVSGITVELSGAETRTAVTNSSGNYSFEDLPADGSFTVKAAHDGYTFTPPSRAIAHLTANERADFATTAQVYGITGQVTLDGVGLSGIPVKLSGTLTKSTLTDANGYYSFADVAADGSFTLAPVHPGYTFTPLDVILNGLAGDQVADFTAVVLRYSIAGRVTLEGTGISGVAVVLSGAASNSVVTDDNGDYSFPGLQAGLSYVVTPSHASYTLTPASRTFGALGGDQAANFAVLPGAAVQIEPGNQQTALPLSTVLSWTGGTAATSHDVYLGTSAFPPLVSNTAGTSYDPPSLNANTKYYWKVVAKNSAGAVSSPVWWFTTGALPAKPTLQSPPNNATNIILAPNLGWKAVAGVSSYNVYFGTTAAPPFAGSVTSNSFVPGPLATGTKYYWRVEAVNAIGTSGSPAWSFKTKLVPDAPANPLPVSTATGVPLGITLEWTGAAGATSYDVYCGTATSPPLIGRTANTSYSVPGLLAGKKYYWRVVAISATGRKTSATWWFVTQ